MKKWYTVNGYRISVAFENQLVRIQVPSELINYLSTRTKLKLKPLVKLIKADYSLLLNKELKIADNSLFSEIYWHIYASRLAKKIKNLIRLKFTDRILNFIINRSDTIDCGENNIDTNRWLWDLLSKI